jgi:predicted nucleic acid-binding protein
VSEFVIDASIVLSWCFPDEDSRTANHVAELFRQNHTAVAPAFWPHEVLNALLAGEKRKRISTPLIGSFLDDLTELPIGIRQFSSEIVFSRIQALSRKHNLTAYDAAYLDLALESRLALATTDEALIRACVKEKIVLVEP